MSLVLILMVLSFGFIVSLQFLKRIVPEDNPDCDRKNLLMVFILHYEQCRLNAWEWVFWNFLVFVLSSIVTIITALLWYLMGKLAKIQKFKNLTQEQTSLMQKLFVIILVNTGALLLVTNSIYYNDTTWEWHISVSV